jgi:hypothetical protein
MRNVLVLAAALSVFGAPLALPMASAEAAMALGRAGCDPDYSRCQQDCRNHSVGGKDYGVGLWDASRSKACFQGCSTARTQCKVGSMKRGTATERR